MKLHQLPKMMVLILALTGLAACGKTSENRSQSRGASGGTLLSATCANGSNAVGYVYDSSGVGFRENVVALLSATMNPSSIGEISSQRGASTGVDMRLRVGTTDGGHVTVANTTLNLIVYDSYVGTKSTMHSGLVEPLTISMNATAVESNGNSIALVFDDDYGRIIVNIDHWQAEFRGTITFQNRVSVVGTPASGTLGSFSVPTCGQ